MRARVMHNHVHQAASPADATVFADDGCLACALIRMEVMSKMGFRMLVQGNYMGEVPQP